MEAITDYGRQAQDGFTESDYPEVAPEQVEFPNEIFIAFAVCHKGCGRSEFIVDGFTQICHYCGKMMFRIVSRKYTLAKTTESANAD